MTDAWLVILNWNGKDDTLELLDSLHAADLPSTTILIVDNASSDGTLADVRRRHPGVEVLQTGANLGYAGGNNRGIEHALAAGADVVGVLNNDTLVCPDFWPPLLHRASEGRTAVCPDIRYAAEPARSWFFGAVVDRRTATTRHLDDAEQPARTGSPDSELLTGCCLVASAETWRAVGGFDERLFLIFEDADWSLRARTAGVRLALEPASVIRHKVSRSFAGQHRGLGLYYYSRNGIVFARRWLGWRAALRFTAGQVLRPGVRDAAREGRAGFRPLVVRVAALGAAAIGPRGAAGPTVRWLCGQRSTNRGAW